MSLRSPLGRVRGLGSAKEGVHHWWMQRLTALALIPLCLWFVIGIIGIADAGYGSVVAWIAFPLNTSLLILLIVALLYHTQLGMQVIVEDYLHAEWLKLAVVIGLRFLTAVLIVVALLAIFHIVFGIA
jgi:succinate dehydrogenase / fumarate reductase membrane anchor subunit